MKRNLLSQIYNERRPNAWLVVELFIVSVVLFYLLVYALSLAAPFAMPTGFDISDTYMLNISSTDAASDIDAETRQQNARELYRRITLAPGVEKAAVATNSIPVIAGGQGGSVTLVGPDSTVRSQDYYRYVEPGYFQIYRIGGIDGLTPQQLDSVLAAEKLVAANGYGNIIHKGFDTRQLIGKWQRDPETVKPRNATEFGAVSKTVRYWKNQIQGDDETVYIPLIGDRRFDFSQAHIAVRVIPGQKAEFERFVNDFKTNGLRVGAFEVDRCEYLPDVAYYFHRDVYRKLLFMSAGVAFLCVSIFLGLFGSFWFRTRQRAGEIAVRIVNGASRRQIFSRLLSEGSLLLCIATAPALVADFLLHKHGITIYENTDVFTGPGLPVVAAAMAFALLWLMILAGIWIPARNAVKTDPARALADE